MLRPELLALSDDDLATLSNRGTVKRARRELESGEVSGELHEDPGGGLTVRWSDGFECRLPADRALGAGRCTCGALGVCRHLVRSVLAYQREGWKAAEPAAEAQGPWDPGRIRDEELVRHTRPAVLARAREQFRQGLLVELVRGVRPFARFESPACTVRFLVPGDARYTHCDCAEPAPCRHVALAVWAFRMLEDDAAAGYRATGPPPPVPEALLDDIEAALLDWAGQGTAGLPASWNDRIARLETRCRGEDLVWPAEVLAELLQERERYAGHDALFDPLRVAELLGELAIRSAAIRAATGAVPPLLVRGSGADRPAEAGSARYIGLGCGVRTGRRGVELAAYLQDADSGSVVVVGRDFADPPPDAGAPPLPYWQLAHTPVLKRATLADLGSGQLILQGGKRTPGRRLLPGRARAVVQPQAFAWEKLRAPVLVESFAELRAQIEVLPPASLRPRRAAEDVHVCPVACVEEVHFDNVAQAIRGVLRDGSGDRALLEHPYSTRGRAGADALLSALQHRSQALRFVAGPVRSRSGELTLSPVALVFQEGSVKRMLQPWIERFEGVSTAAGPAHAQVSSGDDPVEAYPGQLLSALAELFQLGLLHLDAPAGAAWRELGRRGEALGFHRLADRAANLAELLEQRRHTVRWSCAPAGRAALDLAMLVRLAQDFRS